MFGADFSLDPRPLSPFSSCTVSRATKIGASTGGKCSKPLSGIQIQRTARQQF